jgi:hypothetical protein
LKLKCDELLSNVAFESNVRRYTTVDLGGFSAEDEAQIVKMQAAAKAHVTRVAPADPSGAGVGPDSEAGAYTRPLLSST